MKNQLLTLLAIPTLLIGVFSVAVPIIPVSLNARASAKSYKPKVGYYCFPQGVHLKWRKEK